MPGRGDLRRDPAVVEVEDRLVVGDDAAAAGLVLQLARLREQLLVVLDKPVVGRPVPLHQGVLDEQLAGRRRVDPAVVHLAVGDDRQPVQRHLLGRHHRAPAGVPARLAVAAAEQVTAEFLGPLRLDPGHRPGPQPGRLDQLGGHHPWRRLPGQRRVREDRELRAAGAGELDRPAPWPASAASLAGPGLARPARRDGLHAHDARAGPPAATGARGRRGQPGTGAPRPRRAASPRQPACARADCGRGASARLPGRPPRRTRARPDAAGRRRPATRARAGSADTPGGTSGGTRTRTARAAGSAGSPRA